MKLFDGMATEEVIRRVTDVWGGSDGTTHIDVDSDGKGVHKMYEGTWRRALSEGREEFGDTVVHRRFLDRLGFGIGQRVLEVGCGTGLIVDFLCRRGFKASGVDISTTAIGYGLDRPVKRDLRYGSATAIPFPHHTFDVVVSFDLMEHLGDVNLHLAEVSRVLKPGGSYFFETPHKLTNAIWETVRSRSLGWRRYHPSLQWPGELRRRLVRHGFSVFFCKVDIRSEYLNKKIGRTLGRFNFRLLPRWFQPNLYVVAELRG